MTAIDRYRPEDRAALDAFIRLTLGDAAADAAARRWAWQFVHNPIRSPDGPPIWVAREGPAIVGHLASVPVRLWIDGRDIAASWGIDAIVAPERQRRGIGMKLVERWEQSVDAALGLGLTEGAHRMYRKRRWADPGRVPCLVRPLTPRAWQRPGWSPAWNRLVAAVARVVTPALTRDRPWQGQIERLERFGPAFTVLWERFASAFDLAVRRDADYLNWRFFQPPHLTYSVVALKRHGLECGYAVYRHVDEGAMRITVLVDLLADPEDVSAVASLLRWVDRAARDAGSDKIRTFCMHAGYRRIMHRSWYLPVRSTIAMVIKTDLSSLSPTFFDDTSRWHVMLGDSDQDR